MAQIRTTQPHLANEFLAGVQFKDGVAESNRASTLAYFRGRGFTITEGAVPSATPGDDWTLEALHDYAATNGYDLKGATLKADILKIVTGPAPAPAEDEIAPLKTRGDAPQE